MPLSIRSARRVIPALGLSLGLLAGCAQAAPKFDGAREGLAAPRAAVLRWDRAKPGKSGATIEYRIYQRGTKGWEYSRPVATVKGTEHALTNLKPGRTYEFIVRAKDSTGEERNGKVVRVKPTANDPTEEWRGVWISRFEWTGGGEKDLRERIARMMRNLGRGNFNAVVFQVRGQGDTLYPSQIEPWSEMIPAAARRFDPVAVALEEAHRNGLQFHAWLNLMVVWQSKDKAAPRDSKHPFYRWANPKDPARRRGVIYSAPGVAKTWGEADYVWLTPGNPEVEAWVRAVVMEFVARYNVDGLHWDDRTALPHGASHDPVSLERFKGRGNPGKMRSLEEWQRDQLSRMLSNIRIQATQRRPDLLVTASPFGIADKNRIAGYGKYKDAVHDFGSDAEEWLSRGIVDVLMPQVYWAEGDPGPNYGEVVRDWIANNRSGRPIWPGSALGDYGGKQPLGSFQARYVALTRALKAGGNTFFSYTAASDADWANASKTLYPGKARVPRPAHLARPTAGQVAGVVLDTNGKPLCDAWIRVPGRDYVYLSAADGFFGVPGLPPGKHTLTVDAGSGRRRSVDVTVTSGKTATATVRFE